MTVYFHPATVEEAAAILSQRGGTILSGGTDFFPSLGDRPLPGTVVDISAIGGLKGVTSNAQEHRIGGLTTWTDLVRSPLPSCFDALKSAAREIGGVQIQNRGTIAGNLCNASPAADSAPPLLALDAEVELVSVAGKRRIPLSQFLAGNRKTLRRPDEILATVIVPRTMDDAQSAFLKLGARRYLVISIAMVAVVIRMEASNRIGDVRIAVGSCSATAQRLNALEQTIVGLPANEASRHIRPEHLSVLSPIDDVRATASYRIDAARSLVARALERCVVER